MHRFFLPPEMLRGLGPGAAVSLPAHIGEQLLRVLRVRPGETITLLDNSGAAWEACVTALGPHEATARLLARSEPDVEPRVHVVLYQALPKYRKFDWVLQKSTELGVSAIVPLITRNSDVRPANRSGLAKVERWQRIVTEAAEQSGRTRVPQVLPVADLGDALQPTPDGVLALMPYELERSRSLTEALRPWCEAPPREVRLVIGPEGGFDPEEVSLARTRGWDLVSLGPRVLRVETAATVALAIVLYALGETAPRGGRALAPSDPC